MNQTHLEQDNSDDERCRAIFAAASASQEQLEGAAEAPFLYQRIRNELAAIAEAEALRTTTTKQNLLASIFAWRWGFAAVALLVLAFGLWRLAPRRSVAPASQPALAQTVASSPAPRLPELGKSEPSHLRAAALTTNVSSHPVRARKVRAPQPRQEEVLTAFMPLTYIADSAPAGGQLIRIEVTPSMLASLGFTVNPERNQKWLKADVVMGDDGLVRAIRFVQ